MSRSALLSRCRWVGGVVLVLMFVNQMSSADPTGSIKGRVLEKDGGAVLPGANVLVQGTNVGAATDLDGKFYIPNIPAGSQTLRVSYLGYVTLTATVIVPEDGVVERDFRLSAQALPGDTIVVTAQALGQNAAINQQLSSNTITNVVSSARIKEIPDVNAAESIGRLPGVSIQRSGGEANSVSIRGLSSKYNLVTVNGTRLPSSGDDRNQSLLSSVLFNQANPDGYRYGGNDRSVDLGLVSSNTLDGIELKKAVTPDMDADVLGGTIDLKLRDAPEEFQLHTSAQGGYNKLQNYYGNYSFAGNLSNRFFDGTLGVILSGNADQFDRSADKFFGRYERNGPYASQINGIDLREEKVTRKRSGGNLLLDYVIPYGKLNANLFYNQLKSEATYRVNDMNFTDRRHTYDLEDRHGKTDIFTGSLGIKQNYDWIRFDAGVSRTGSESTSPDERGFHFSQETGQVFSNFNRDTTTTPGEIVKSEIVDTNATKFADAYKFDTKRSEYQTTVQLNIEAPYRLTDDLSGYLKLGAKFRQLDRMNDEEVYGISGLQYGGGVNQLTSLMRALGNLYPDQWNYERDSAYVRATGWLPVTRFLYDYSRSNFLNSQYPLGLAIDPAKANQLMEAMILTPSAYQRYMIPSLGRDYDGVERYQAAYVMGELNIADFVTLLAGARWEKDYALYHGQRYRAVITGGNTQGPPLDYTPLTSERGNNFWLPSANVTVKPLDWLRVRLVYTKTLTRPDFRQYAPITFMDANQTQVVAANYDLKPALSTNYDLSVSIFDNSVGLLSVSGFYKRIDDLIFTTSYAMLPGIGPPPGSNIPTSWTNGANPTLYGYPMNNSTPAYIRGFELEWQTHFWYLPSILRGLVLNVNYTRIGSNVDIHYFATSQIRLLPLFPPRYTNIAYDAARSSRVPGQPSSIVNVTLGYDIEGFSTRLSYRFDSDRVNGINQLFPSLDDFTTNYERWDLTVQQSISEWGLQVFANFSNLNGQPDEVQLAYQYYHPTSIEYYGFSVDLGIRFKL